MQQKGEHSELKTPNNISLNAIDKRHQKGLHQIRKNPGGVIINLKKDEININDLAKIIENRLIRSGGAGVQCDVMVLIEDKLRFVVRK